MTDPTGAVPHQRRGNEDVLAARLLCLAQAAADLSSASDVTAVGKVVTAHVGPALGAVAVSLSVVASPTALELVLIEGDTPGTALRGTRFPLDLVNPITEAARTRSTVTAVGRAAVLSRYPALYAGLADDRSVVAVPLVAGGELHGVVGLAFDRRLELDDVDQQFLQAVTDTCAQAVARLGAEHAEQDRFTQLSFLAEVSADLGRSLDYEQTLRRLAELVVPDIAEWCVIDVLDDGALRPVAVAHVDPDKVALAHSMRERYPPDLEAPTGAHVVARTGLPELWEDVDPALVEASARDAEHLRLARELDLRSAMCVPLVARDRTLGVLTLVRSGDSRRYSRTDLAFAQELARRAAVAIDNAQLHTETLEASLQLQHAVLPASFGDTGPWDIAVHYRPAGRTAVGGDFYDAVRLPDGRLVAFVGDVMGRGVAAAAAMAQVRSALRAYVAIDPDPVTVISRLSVMFEQLELPQLVTVLYAVLDPGARQAQLLSAGHLPPFLVHADGDVERLTVPSSPPLGAGEHSRHVVTVDYDAGDVLLVVTDGLVERRGEDLDGGLDRLLGAAAALGDDVSDARLGLIADELRQSGHDDDVTLLAVRHR